MVKPVSAAFKTLVDNADAALELSRSELAKAVAAEEEITRLIGVKDAKITEASEKLTAIAAAETAEAATTLKGELEAIHAEAVAAVDAIAPQVTIISDAAAALAVQEQIDNAAGD